ncbi:MAG: DUF1286 domain-containing protein [Pyrobaculum sp.]
MKSETHMWFSLGTVLYPLAHVVDLTSALALAVLLSALVNFLIDALGHERRGGAPRRTPTTHDPVNALILGAATGGFVGWALGQWLGPNLALHGVWAGAYVALGHLFLDLFTGHGIYIRSGGRYRRVVIGGVRYDDKLANGSASLLGAALFVYVLLKNL